MRVHHRDLRRLRRIRSASAPWGMHHQEQSRAGDGPAPTGRHCRCAARCCRAQQGGRVGSEMLLSVVVRVLDRPGRMDPSQKGSRPGSAEGGPVARWIVASSVSAATSRSLRPCRLFAVSTSWRAWPTSVGKAKLRNIVSRSRRTRAGAGSVTGTGAVRGRSHSPTPAGPATSRSARLAPLQRRREARPTRHVPRPAGRKGTGAVRREAR